ncbi:GTP-binding protein [Tenacibaculum mesophilum]|uniref:Large ribosomal subunit assembly factor BipA n=2 Tax=Tenacibaculum TaxID=104267 RepID=A0AAE9SEI6_9FLAO|nr:MULTISPECIES: translational GTPase TypA [Tenacibaculum]GFD76580.1 GTP-binding protein [Tenacibaculum sp. KUL113]GFD82842.1 GTP-binding protein [Tenacibaculum sp. KUL118]AZJ31734.1 translational GTPase TypA [Tenacibaculum mesophilum]MCO7185710.1 translational GTPase TypA [Tenacibaculum sp. XPcli2-G]QFS26988.1 translational GTPase TypA [Tenacibaculum mesophilum]|eukprot:TRINITY_DN2023_c0_g1_i5.p1 TRINITY_DN2023_c0_g1~~TRINITY_DN2023_c0_g1_i5.p1  ORF type:complete len:591 (+),score=139.42 TRINITY_DN2023_c0_g1_i5:179-1951(+)
MQSIRNIAIIAHVDHGKTTLVDKIIDQAKILDERKERTDLLLDNNDLERERGITILSKNVSVNYKGVKINVIDTPGHADFGGEVERVLKMADGVLLLVDAFEGPMPQTRFVLGKAIELGLTPIVVVNKVDKENCTPDLVHEKVFDLMFALEANEDQLDFTTIYGSAKNGWMSTDWQKPTEDIVPLLDAVLETIPEAPYREGSPQMQITSLDYSSFKGRIAIGRVYRGDLEKNKDYMLCKADGSTKKVRIKELHVFEGMGKAEAEKVRSGDICAVTGLDDFEIGDTIADVDNPEALPRIEVDQPTMSMLFTINNSPFFGKEGKFVTSRHLRDRLFKEMEKNLALRVDETDTEDKFNVFGRGVLHLSVLIETMRREGYELQVGRPQVILKEIDGVKCEPYETLSIDVPEDVASKAINLVSLRKGDLLVMEPKGDLQHLEFTIPSRGLIGLRNKILTATAGQAIINHRFSEYGPYKGEFAEELKGAIVSSETGKATAYAIDRLQDRGRFFIDPNQEIYKGQVVGENAKADDMAVNLIKGKKLTNVRASGSDDGVKIAPKIDFSLEECMEYIRPDEYLEVTPESLRMRKINFVK